MLITWSHYFVCFFSSIPSVWLQPQGQDHQLRSSGFISPILKTKFPYLLPFQSCRLLYLLLHTWSALVKISKHLHIAKSNDRFSVLSLHPTWPVSSIWHSWFTTSFLNRPPSLCFQTTISCFLPTSVAISSRSCFLGLFPTLGL